LKDALKSVVALDAKEANMVVANSVDVANAVSRGLDANIFWVMQDLHDSEGLIVNDKFTYDHQTDSGITEPRHLIGKRVGVWWASSQHYSLCRFFDQLQIPYQTAYDYQYQNAPSHLMPNHWSESSAVTLVPLSREELWTEWENYGIQAAWVGFPHMHYFKPNGTILATNRVLSDWRMVTFDAFLIDRYWMDNPPVPPGRTMNVRSFLRTFLAEMAKANFYYENNTKEFSMTHRVTKGVLETPVLRVDGKIAGVLGTDAELTWPHIQFYKYPTIQDQLTCEWMGCETKSRIAWSLMDQAHFLKTVHYGSFIHQDGSDGKRGLADGNEMTILDYAGRVMNETLLDLDRTNVDGYYELVAGEEVEFGYHDDYAD